MNSPDSLDGKPIIFLKPSSIQGIGCFTDRAIPKGAVALEWAADDFQRVEAASVTENKWLYERYCIRDGEHYLCPLDFQRMSVGWYLNHSKDPNIASSDEGDTWIALRDIAEQEELVIDYDQL